MWKSVVAISLGASLGALLRWSFGNRLLLSRTERRDAIVKPFHQHVAVGTLHRCQQLHEQLRGIRRPLMRISVVRKLTRSEPLSSLIRARHYTQGAPSGL